MRMCVSAVVGKTHLQRVLLSAQRRETAVRTRGYTDKSPQVLGGFTGVLTIAALGGLLLDYLHTRVNTFFGSFLSFFYRFCSAFHVCTLSFLLARQNGFHNWKAEHILVCFSPSEVLYHPDFLCKLWQMSEIKWRFDSLFTFKLGRPLLNVTRHIQNFFLFFILAQNSNNLTSVFTSSLSESCYSLETCIQLTYAVLRSAV